MIGGRSRIRTYDPLIKSQLLYQLSYAPAATPWTLAPGGEGAENTRKRRLGKGGWKGIFVARRDLTGAVDFGYLEGFAAGDAQVVEEVLALFREQAAIWSKLLHPDIEGWRDAVHTLKGTARGIGANQLGTACEHAEEAGAGALSTVHAALDATLADVAAYLHELAIQSLRTSPRL